MRGLILGILTIIALILVAYFFIMITTTIPHYGVNHVSDVIDFFIITNNIIAQAFFLIILIIILVFLAGVIALFIELLLKL